MPSRMIGIRIADGVGDDQEPLAVDLRDILRALGPEAADWMWIVSSVRAPNKEFRSEEFMATGDGADELEALMRSGSRVSSAQLAAIADRTRQVIWGAFRAFPQASPDRECARILAIDSTFYEVWCRDATIAERILRAFKDTISITTSYEADDDLDTI